MMTPGPYIFKDSVVICGVQEESDAKCLGMETCTEHLPRDLFTSPYFLLLVFIVCLRGAQPCTINPVSDRQTLLCLLFCCWLPQTSMCTVVTHVAFSPLCPVTVHSGRCSKCCSIMLFMLDVKVHLKNRSFGLKETFCIY